MFWDMCISHKLLFATFATLVLAQLTISQSEEENEVSENWGLTDFKISQLKYTWTINNFRICCLEAEVHTYSPNFSVNDGCKWYLRLSLKNENDNKNFALYLFSKDCDKKTNVKLSILNNKQEPTNVMEFSHEFKPGSNWGFANFVSQAFLLNAENNLLSDNKLTIICEVIALEGNDSSSGQLVSKSGLVEDFGHLLENHIFSDVTLTAGVREFKVHKAILAARSSVFKAIFESTTENSTNQVVNITDLDSQTLSEMLNYIYTEEETNLKKPILTANLLTAAENYKLDGLKTMCEKALIADLSLNNAVEYLILGDKTHADDLKTEANHFIVSHASDITNTTSFKSLISTQPRLALETFKLLR